MAGPEDEIDEDDWAAALIAQNGEGGEASLADEWGAALAEQGTTTHASDVAAEWATMIEDGETDNLPELAGNDRILNQDEIDGVLGFSLRELSASGAGGVSPLASVTPVTRSPSTMSPETLVPCRIRTPAARAEAANAWAV